MKRYYLLNFSFYLILLTGCSTLAVQQSAKVSNNTTDAELFMHSGQHKKAAHLYRTLAQSKPERRNQYSFLAAEAFLQSGDNAAAHQLLSSIKPATLSSTERNKLHFFYAQIYLSRGETKKALNNLKLTQVNNLHKKDQITYYQSLAFAYSLSEKPLLSAKARTQLSLLLTHDEDRYKNNSAIFNTLNGLPLQALDSNHSAASGDLRGWIALSRLFKVSGASQGGSTLQDNLIEWEQLYPEHPANSDFLESYLNSSTKVASQPASIALLLPESGRFSQAALAIKEGFMAAYNQNQEGFQPSLIFYDSSINSPVDLYHQAVSEGAELIIGPLSKDNIQLLAQGTELTVPVLALNHVLYLVKNNLFQFGLSPIDEAKQSATRAYLREKKNVLLISPESNKGKRIEGLLTDYWHEIGGGVLESQLYNAKENDFSTSIKELLNLNESIDRYKQLKRVLTTDIEHEPRIRKDTDAIFLSATSKTARSIYPQLRFYGATNIPVYAVTQVYSGIPQKMLDKDMNGVSFCDIPWLFPQSYLGDLSQESLQGIWQNLPNKYLRLVALGIDSFSLVSHLNQISLMPYEGATGKLSLNANNRITRQLVCAKFKKGEIQLISPLYEQNIAPKLQEENYSDEFSY